MTNTSHSFDYTLFTPATACRLLQSFRCNGKCVHDKEKWERNETNLAFCDVQFMFLDSLLVCHFLLRATFPVLMMCLRRVRVEKMDNPQMFLCYWSSRTVCNTGQTWWWQIVVFVMAAVWSIKQWQSLKCRKWHHCFTCRTGTFCKYYMREADVRLYLLPSVAWK